jgi:hypothetical protein
LELDGLLVGFDNVAKLLSCSATTSWASLLVNFNDVGRAANHRVHAACIMLLLVNSITITAITLSNRNLADVRIMQLSSNKRSIAACGTTQAILIERTRAVDDF